MGWLLILSGDTGQGQDKPKKTKAPSGAKKPLSPAQLEQRRKAGKSRAKSFTKEHQSAAGKARAKAFTREYQSRAWYARLARRGTEHFTSIGRKGWLTSLERYPEFYEQGGLVSRKLTLARLAKSKLQKEHDTVSSDAPVNPPENGENETDGSQ